MDNIKYYCFCFVLFCFISYKSISQISYGGYPLSFNQENKILNVNSIPIFKMPKIDIKTLIKEDSVFDKTNNRPWRFGENIKVNINVKKDGLLESTIDGGKLWRLIIYSEDALSLNLVFNNYKLPPKAKLFIYNEDKTQILGSFTEKNNQKDGIFATTLIYDDKITIEYYEPRDVLFDEELIISQVTHGYRKFDNSINGFGSSGSCNVNVACPESMGMEDQIRSTCMLVTGSNGFCSGALINNTENDGKPYILSADHCYSSPSTLIVWFNWQSETCSNPGTSPSANSISGATDRARNSDSDFWLFELNNYIPSGYEVYYSGWNRTTNNSISGKVWCIHHPLGDIKKISWSNSGVNTTTYLNTSVPGDSTHWRVYQWDDNTTTEGGSSGAPLFDNNGRIIGQLHGGYASCSDLDSDWFGKFGTSWTGGGTNDSRLSNWLDPISSGKTEINGYDPNLLNTNYNLQILNIIEPLVSYCSPQTITPKITIKNIGIQTITSADVCYTINNGDSTCIEWTGNLSTGEFETISFIDTTLNVGINQTFTGIVMNPNDSIDENPSNNNFDFNFSVYGSFSPPFIENFESSNFPPDCWTEEIVGGNTNWKKYDGSILGYPDNAFDGTGNALLYNSSFSSDTTKLITPPINLNFLSNPTLTFYHTQADWSGDQDELNIYYKTSSADSWKLLESYTESVETWTQRNISLPNISNEYYIAFEGIAKYGYGVCIDSINVSGSNNNIENSDKQNIILFPNPTKDYVMIKFNDNTSSKFNKIRINDINGRLIYETNINNEKNINIDLNNISKGLYFINLYSDNQKITKKLVVM